MRCCQNKISFSWSYQDSSKRSLENNVISRRGREKYTLWDRWTCENGKEWSRGTKEVLVIGLHMVGKMSLDLNFSKLLKFLMHFREPGSSLYFFYTYSYFFFSHTYFFLYLFFSLYSFFSFSSFFYLLPLNSKLHCTYLPPCLDVCSSLGKEVIEIR
jgi:hypothetical protein